MTRSYPLEAGGPLATLETLLSELEAPFGPGDAVGIKLHWGEKGNQSFLPPDYARALVAWLKSRGCSPFIFDTTVLYSGGRHTAEGSLATAASHGYTEDVLGCPVIIGDGADGRSVVDIPAGFTHFDAVQVAALTETTAGFVIFSHFKGHLASGFGGCIKNLAMGFASRAQKQRMHADVTPTLIRRRCTRCGVCTEVCPTCAAQIHGDDYPTYDLDLCIGCAQCIAQCPEMALKILWGSNQEVFQEKLVETAAAVWNRIAPHSVLINAVLNVTADCDCLPGPREIIGPDVGFVTAAHPLTIDEVCLDLVGREIISRAHPRVPWSRQLSCAREIGFCE